VGSLLGKYSTLTNLMILLSIIGYIIQHSLTYGSALLGLNHLFITEHFYHQALTTLFTHGNLMHIVMNMVVLYQFGNLIEHHLGHTTFITLYLGGGVLTSLASIAFISTFELSHNLVGASGAISVLLGFYAHRIKSERKGIIIWVLLISFAPLLIGIPIAWYAHLFGFIFGMLYSFITLKVTSS
jgi:membrane associated rhomboid family serine protease